MKELEKMLSSKIYDPADKELVELRCKAHNLSREYNKLGEEEVEKRTAIIKELFNVEEVNFYLQGPIQMDYGRFTKFGKNSYANFNLTILDCAPVNIGNTVYIGPNVSIYPPVHPMHFTDREIIVNKDGNQSDQEYALPITIEDDCWIAGNVTICGGVTIGKGSVIGAGSVVTHDIPPMSFAAGNPCKVIRKIEEKDLLKNHPELFAK